jgi:hypothetical protein
MIDLHPPLDAAAAGEPAAARIGRVVGQLQPHRGPSRVLGWTALFWLGSAAVHLAVWAVDGGPWAGPVSWRKPIVFSLSFGLLLWAFGWLLDRLPDRPRLAWPLAVGLAVTGTAEVGLIAGQTWRGEASHFNTAEPGDGQVFVLMGIMIGIASIAIVTGFVWSLVERPADPLARSAALWGFLLVIAGLGIGQWIIELGNDYVNQFDQVPSTVTHGEAGVAKFPHAVAFHGIQLFALAAAMLSVTDVAPGRARSLMRLVVTSYLGVLVFSAFQTGSGRAPADVELGSAALLALSSAILVATLAGITWAVLRPADRRRLQLA